MFDTLFNTQDANFVCKIRKKSRVDDIIKGPFAIDARRNKLVLSLETLRSHCVYKALNFSLVRYRSITLRAIKFCTHWRLPDDMTHFDPATVAEVEIRFISRLKAEKSVAENLLTFLYNV